MRIHPPKVIVDENEPFKHALFGRKNFADSLTGLLRNVSEGLVVFVNAPWGEGKTTFSEMWRADLRRQKLDVIYFDAYAADYFDDPFVSFSGEILELVDKRLAESKGSDAPRREFKKTAVEIGKRLAGLAVKVGVRAATMGAVDSTHIAELQEIGTEVASDVSKIAAEIIEKKIENYAAEKDSLKAFKKSLEKLAKVVREEQGFPLTIIVDELDRCRPDFALGLLERIKHLFDVEGVAFVLLVNQDQIETYIRAVYGENVDARSYLLKFANLFVDLPSQQSVSTLSNYENGLREYCVTLFQHYGLSKLIADPRFLLETLRSHVGHFNLTLRETEKVFTILALFYSSQSDCPNAFLIAMLSILKVKRPSLYQQLSTASLSMEDFFKETKIDRIMKTYDQYPDPVWAKDTLSFFLMSDSEFEEATKNPDGTENFRSGPGQMRNFYRGDRKKVVPFICSQLDRFSLKPQ